MAGRNARAMAKLAEWAQRFERVASPQFRAAQTKDLSKITLGLIEEGFRTESTPTRQKWRPKKIPNGEQILVEKRIMRQGFSARVKVGEFTITNARPWVGAHQYGAPSRNIPRRQMWPDASRLPARYIKAYTDATVKRFFRYITKGSKR